MNSITLTGKLCKGSELKFSGNNTAFFKGSIACWDGWKKELEFFDFVVFGKSAERIADWSFDGCRLEISGKLDTNKWEDNSGMKRVSYSVNVREFDIVKEMPNKGDVVDDGRPDNTDIPENPSEEEDIPF